MSKEEIEKKRKKKLLRKLHYQKLYEKLYKKSYKETYLERVHGENWFVYNDLEVYITEEINREVCSAVRTLLFGKLIKKGKRIYAFKIYERILYGLKKERKKEPLYLIVFAVLNCLLEFRFIRKRIGGQRKEIPLPISFSKQIQTAVTNLIDYVITDKRTTIDLQGMIKLIIDSNEFKGAIIRDNTRMYKIATENKVLLKYLK